MKALAQLQISTSESSRKNVDQLIHDIKKKFICWCNDNNQDICECDQLYLNGGIYLLAIGQTTYCYCDLSGYIFSEIESNASFTFLQYDGVFKTISGTYDSLKDEIGYIEIFSKTENNIFVLKNNGEVLYNHIYGIKQLSDHLYGILDNNEDDYLNYSTAKWDYVVDANGKRFSKKNANIKQEKYTNLIDSINLLYYEQNHTGHPILNIITGEICKNEALICFFGKISLIKKCAGQYYFFNGKTSFEINPYEKALVWRHSELECSILVFRKKSRFKLSCHTGEISNIYDATGSIENLSPLLMRYDINLISQNFVVFEYSVNDSIIGINKNGVIVLNMKYEINEFQNVCLIGDYLCLITSNKVKICAHNGTVLTEYLRNQIMVPIYYDGIEQAYSNTDIKLAKYEDKYGLIDINTCKNILPIVFDKIQILPYKSPFFNNKSNSESHSVRILYMVCVKDLTGKHLSGIFSSNGEILPIGNYKSIRPLTYTITSVRETHQQFPSGHDSLISPIYEIVKSSVSKKIFFSGWMIISNENSEQSLWYDGICHKINQMTECRLSECSFLFLIIKTDDKYGIFYPKGWLIKPRFKQIIEFADFQESQTIHEFSNKYYVCDSKIYKVTIIMKSQIIDDVKVDLVFDPKDLYIFAGIKKINCINYVMYCSCTEINEYGENVYYAHNGYSIQTEMDIMYPNIDEDDY